jgi:hypothetical protein
MDKRAKKRQNKGRIKSNEEVVRNIDRETGINNKAKSQKATEEAVRLLQEKTHEPGLLDNIMGKFKNVDLNPFD